MFTSRLTFATLVGTMLTAIFAPPVASQHFPLGVREPSSLPIHRTQSWLQNLFGDRASGWESPRSTIPDENARRGNPIGRSHASTGGYRTLCVRLCDGYYWPISNSAPRNRFSKDAKQCETACPNRSQLFVQPLGRDDVDGMVDLKGIPYTLLKNALRYRSEYLQDCTCRGNPWDAEALARHQSYAQAAKPAPEQPHLDKKQTHDKSTKSRVDLSARAAGLSIRD